MRRPLSNCAIALTLLVFGFGIGSGLPRAGAEPLRMRVLTYNIHHGEGVDGKLELDRIAKVINSVKPDVVSVQEVDQKVQRSRNVDQPAELMRLTGMHGIFGSNLKLQAGDYGNLVLSRWPIKSHRNHKLPSSDDGEPRGVLEAEIELPNERETLTFLATHFDHRANERERIASAERINEMTTQPLALLAGDLNAVPESNPLKILQTVWKVASEHPQPTIPVDQPTRQIDFVLLKPASRWKVVETRVLDEAVASDHRAFLATLELLPAEK